MRKRYTEEFKQELVGKYIKGHGVKELCEQHEVTKSALYNWIKQYKEVKMSTGESLTARDVYLLKCKIKRLSIENEILKNSRCSVNASLGQKLDEMTRLYATKKYSVKMLCSTFNVLKSTFYHHIFRAPEKKWYEIEDDFLRPLILVEFERSKRRYGSDKIRAMLMRQGITVSEGRTMRLMREMNLVCKVSTKKPKYPKANRNTELVNHLQRKFNPPTPNLVWASDITYLRINYSTAQYLCIVMDLYSRKIISYNISKHMTSEEVLQAFKDAYTERLKPYPLIFHSDRGAQYTSSSFQGYLKNVSVTQSYSDTGCPFDNAVVEAFFSCLKKEEFYRHKYRSIKELIASIDEYINDYNTTRIQKKLGNLSPDEAEEKYRLDKEKAMV